MNTKADMNNTQTKPLSNEVLGALADAFGKDVLTIKRWVKKNDDRLTSDKAKQVFREKKVEWSHQVAA